MKIMICHNHYQQAGGEDAVFADESALLARYGHRVTLFTVHNGEVADYSRAALAAATIWNRRTCATLGRVLYRERPKVVHFHNTFPLLSPGAYYVARRHGAAVVQTLHNFRLLCPQATFFRDDRVCEDCLARRLAWPAVIHRCYRNSLGASVATVAMLAAHRILGTWEHAVDRYVTMTEFARRKFVAGGLPEHKMTVKPNFVAPAPPLGDGRGGYAVFVGRLSPEKGLPTLLQAWRTLGERIPLKIVGDGPSAPLVREAVAANAAVEWLGPRSADEVQAIVGAAAFLVLPSICYEGLPKVLVEAFASGTPVVVSRLGALPELVDDGRTGVCFQPGDPLDLAEKVSGLLSDHGRLSRMREEARAEFDSKYTADRNYKLLMSIYERALAGCTAEVGPSAGSESRGEAVCLPNP